MIRASSDSNLRNGVLSRVVPALLSLLDDDDNVSFSMLLLLLGSALDGVVGAVGVVVVFSSDAVFTLISGAKGDCAETICIGIKWCAKLRMVVLGTMVTGVVGAVAGAGAGWEGMTLLLWDLILSRASSAIMES